MIVAEEGLIAEHDIQSPPINIENFQSSSTSYFSEQISLPKQSDDFMKKETEPVQQAAHNVIEQVKSEKKQVTEQKSKSDTKRNIDNEAMISQTHDDLSKQSDPSLEAKLWQRKS